MFSESRLWKQHQTLIMFHCPLSDRVVPQLSEGWLSVLCIQAWRGVLGPGWGGPAPSASCVFGFDNTGWGRVGRQLFVWETMPWLMNNNNSVSRAHHCRPPWAIPEVVVHPLSRSSELARRWRGSERTGPVSNPSMRSELLPPPWETWPFFPDNHNVPLKSPLSPGFRRQRKY